MIVVDTHTDTQNDYCNPRCACAPRVNYKEEIRTYKTEYRDMDEDDDDKVQWMRSVYREVPFDSPVLKHVKASDDLFQHPTFIGSSN